MRVVELKAPEHCTVCGVSSAAKVLYSLGDGDDRPFCWDHIPLDGMPPQVENVQ